MFPVPGTPQVDPMFQQVATPSSFISIGQGPECCPVLELLTSQRQSGHQPVEVRTLASRPSKGVEVI